MAQRRRVSGTGGWGLRLATALYILLAGGTAYAQTPPIDPNCSVISPSIGTPTVTLTPGELYFRDNGTPSLLLGTNPTGWLTTHFDELFGYATANDTLVRIHLTNGKVPNPTLAGEVDCVWVQFWDDVFYRAEQSGLHVIPVFEVWADWNIDTTGTRAQAWAFNIYNVANGASCLDGSQACLATDPVQLLRPGITRDTWIASLRALVERWKDRPNIFGWEIFSELDLITSATDAEAADFVNAAAAEIRAEDPSRPVTASMSGNMFLYWDLLAGSSIDFIQLHPYGNVPLYDGDLDRLILDKVSDRRTRYPGKPLFIGESGLDSRKPVDPLRNPVETLTMSANAPVGLNQAIWASAVSGAMTGRMLWFEDGYDRYHPALADLCAYAQYAAYAACADMDPLTVLTLRELYANASAAVARFVGGVDYSGFAPITLTINPAMIGATLGNTDVVLGWVRDSQSNASNDWTVAAPLTGQSVTIDVPGVSADWLVDFYDTTTGNVIQTIDADQDVNGDITLTLPDFSGSIGFKIRAVPPLAVTIDIIPAGSLNRINMSTPGGVRVAISSTVDFLADTVVDVSTVRFGPAGAAARSSSAPDLNGDGLADLRMRFRKSDTGFVCGDTEGVLTGETVTGRSFTGSDAVSIRMIPPCPP